MDCKRQGRWQRARVLAPADLQPSVVEGKTLIRSNLEEREGGCGVNEGDELATQLSVAFLDAMRYTYSNMLVLHVAQTLKDTTTDGVAEILSCCLGVDITQIDGAVESRGTSETLQ